MRPGVRALALLVLLCVIAVFANPQPLVWAIALGGVVLLLLFDLIGALVADGPTVTRKVNPTLPVNRVSEVTLGFENSTRYSTRLTVFDEFPESMQAQGLPGVIHLKPGARLELIYRVTPGKRGDAEFGQTQVLLTSPLGFWQVKRFLAEPEAVRVYPDFSILSRYLELVSDQQVHQLGIKLAPRRGDGLEFHQLREYRSGDALRQVDWKATARHSKLISKEYQEERDQQVLFLLDAGRRMRSQDGALSHFDHALNAVLLLAYVALKQGDSVSALSFGSERIWLAPMRGVSAINRLLQEVYRLQCGLHAADYVSAAEEVLRTQRKRALVVLLTNLREEDEDLAPALKLLRKRHVVLLANLREVALDPIRESPIHDFSDALQYAGTMDYLIGHRERHRTLARLANVAIQTTPAELPIAVVNSYWQIKRSGVL